MTGTSAIVPSDYNAISIYNEEQLGKDRRSRMSQVAMYADSAHFVYELLQNADDAGAKEIQFVLSPDSLVVEHDGAPFTNENVRAISYFGKGKTDVTAIGHFGLGFKSVFAYTSSPRVHSGEESFRIADLYTVSAEPYPADLATGRTRFVLPFDHVAARPDYVEKSKWRTNEDAYEEIDEKLSMLGGETLLFTRSLRKIAWSTSNATGNYVRVDSALPGGGEEVLLVTGGEDRTHFLTFSRAIHWPDDEGIERPRRPVSIAFQLTDVAQSKGRVTGPEHQKLWVFFPTDKDTYFGFIAQGPYRTTPARDNIPESDEFNRHLVNETAELIHEALARLRALKILDFELIARMPLDPERFGKGRFYHPIHQRVVTFLKEERAWPAYPSGYVAGNEAKLARGRYLAELLDGTQLSALFKKEGLRWIHPDLTENAHPELHRYLVGMKRDSWSNQWAIVPLIESIEVRPEEVAKRFSKEFLEAQSEIWLVKLYIALGAARGNLYQQFRDCPLIRREDGTHVAAFIQLGKAAVFLPTDEETSFPTVKKTLVDDERVKQFLIEVVGLRPPDLIDDVLRKTLPAYAVGAQPRSLAQWKGDFDRFVAALSTATPEKRNQLIKTASAVHLVLASENVSGRQTYVLGAEAYFRNDEISMFFEGNEKAFLVELDRYPPAAEEILTELGVARQPRMSFRNASYDGYVAIDSFHGYHSRGLNRFDPDWRCDGLAHALANPNEARSRFIWNRYVLPCSHLVKGVVETSTRRTFDSSTRSEKYSEPGKLLVESAWLPSDGTSFFRPAELLPADLPNEFGSESAQAKAAAEMLGMRKPEALRAAEVLVGSDTRNKALIERFAQAIKAGDEGTIANFEKLLAGSASKPTFVSFRDGIQKLHRVGQQVSHQRPQPSAVANPERYLEVAVKDKRTEMDASAAKAFVPRFSIVRAGDGSSSAREFLYQQYEGRCQVTGRTFQKADGSNYFEAISLVPFLDSPHFNDPGNMLCLSADSAARFLYGSFEWVEDLGAKVESFHGAAEGGADDNRTIRIRMSGEYCQITFSERHFLRLKALWDAVR